MLALSREELAEKLLRLSQSFLRKHDGLCLAHGARDVSLGMKSLHRVPIEALPSPRSLVKTEIEQCEYCFVNFFGIDFHRRVPGSSTFSESCPAYAHPCR